jgi:hypothetical protein
MSEQYQPDQDPINPSPETDRLLRLAARLIEAFARSNPDATIRSEDVLGIVRDVVETPVDAIPGQPGTEAPAMELVEGGVEPRAKVEDGSFEELLVDGESGYYDRLTQAPLRIIKVVDISHMVDANPWSGPVLLCYGEDSRGIFVEFRKAYPNGMPGGTSCYPLSSLDNYSELKREVTQT